MGEPNVRFVNRGNRSGEIWLYDQVGADPWFGGISAKSFADELNKLGKVDVVNLRINSPGGSVFDGLAIYNTLARHPARIEVDVDGVAASIASVIAMAGDEIRMASNATMMIHDPYGMSAGSAQDMRKTADLLDQIKGQIVDTYANRTGKDATALADMMANETWMTAQEARQHGFSDATTEEQRIAAYVDLTVFNFKHPPKRADANATPARDIASVRLALQQKRMAGSSA
jgi:ATP-dependent Clp protease protease subunit